MTKLSHSTYTLLANSLRIASVDMVERAQSGHPGLPLGCADIMAVLWASYLRFDAQNVAWPNRDRFILSAGHGCALLYATLHFMGVSDLSIDALKNFRHLGSKTPGHPEWGLTQGVEATTGPLGQGLGMAVGMTMAMMLQKQRLGDLFSHKIYTLVSDGDLMEGISHEAISLAGHLKLNHLIALYDDNKISIDGATHLSDSTCTKKRFEAAQWDVIQANGHDYDDIYNALAQAQNTKRPCLIMFATTIGYGAPTKQGTASCHGAPLGTNEIKGVRDFLGVDWKPFSFPHNVYEAWNTVRLRGHSEFEHWENEFKQHPDLRQEFNKTRAMFQNPGAFSKPLLQKLALKVEQENKKQATRQASSQVVHTLMPHMPVLIGGSADLSSSTGTLLKDIPAFRASLPGRFIHYGIREHAMGAIMNGLALYEGFVPYGSTFLVFSDYARGAIRLSALMGTRVIYIFTHDSIGVGEDGATHQPIEHLATLRAIPGLEVFRPADACETIWCWQVALEAEMPSVLVLTRQGLPELSSLHHSVNSDALMAQGAYEVVGPQNRLREVAQTARVSLLATGSEVGIALQARDLLEGENIPTRVVSVPSLTRFSRTSHATQQTLLQPNTLRFAIEAGISMPWQQYISTPSCFLGMEHFGASAPGEDLYKHFGITPHNLAKKVLKELKR